MKKIATVFYISSLLFLYPSLGFSICVQVVSTTGIIAEVVEQVGAGHVRVKSLMGTGVDPHSYKASAGDLRRLQQADLIFFNGLYLEAKLAEVLHSLKKAHAVTAQMPASVLLNTSTNSELADPHVWMSAELWQFAVTEIVRVLSQYCSEQKELFSKNAAAYSNQLLELHNYALQQISSIPLPVRTLVTAHDAFQYFGQSYGIEVQGVQGISTISEASIARVQELANLIAAKKIPAIFVESSVSPRTILALKAAVESRGFQVRLGGELFSDSLGPKNEPTGNYAGMFKHNINTIVQALR